MVFACSMATAWQWQLVWQWQYNNLWRVILRLEIAMRCAQREKRAFIRTALALPSDHVVKKELGYLDDRTSYGIVIQGKIHALCI